MLQKLRDQTQGTGFRVITVLLIFALVVGLGAANFFASTSSDVAEVGGQGISEFDLSRQTERERRRILSQLGEDFNPNDLDRNQIQQFALSRLINEEVSRQTLVDLGLGFSNRAIDKELINSPAYGGAEGFDNDLYLAQITALGYTNESFKAAVGVDLGAGLLRRAIESSLYVGEKEVDDAYRFIQQKRDLAYIKLSYQEYSEKVILDEEDMVTRYEEEKDRFLSEEILDLEYVLLNEKSVKRKFDLSAELTEAQLLNAYDAESKLKLDSVERASSHILLVKNQSDSEEGLREKASQLRERVLSGESFEELARSFSDDEVSASEGGSLGFAGRGVFEPEFESVLWALESVGDISEVFETKFGFHIVRLDEIASVDIASFEDRKDALREDLIGELAREKLEIMAEELERFVFEESISLVNTSLEFGLGIESLRDVSALNFAEKFGSDPSTDSGLLSEMLFSGQSYDGENSPVINLPSGDFLVYRVTERTPPAIQEFDVVKTLIREELVRENTRFEIERLSAEALGQLQDDVNVGDVAASIGQTWKTLSNVGRGFGEDEQEREVVDAAFLLPRPSEDKKVFDSVNLSDGSVALVALTKVVFGDKSSSSSEELDLLRQAVGDRNRLAEYSSFLSSSESALGVTRNF